MNIGERIAYLRESMGLSQGNVAEYLGVKQSYLSMIEKNERPCLEDMAIKLATLFNMDVRTLQDTSISLVGLLPVLGRKIKGEDLAGFVYTSSLMNVKRDIKVGDLGE